MNCFSLAELDVYSCKAAPGQRFGQYDIQRGSPCVEGLRTALKESLSLKCILATLNLSSHYCDARYTAGAA